MSPRFPGSELEVSQKWQGPGRNHSVSLLLRVLVQPMLGSMEGRCVKERVAKDVWKPKPLRVEETGRCLSCKWRPMRRKDWR